MVFRYEFGNDGLQAEIQQGDIGTQLQDEHPGAVLRLR